MRTLLTVIGMLGLTATAQAQPVTAPSKANAAQEQAAPAMARYTRDLLFGEVWKRPGLSPRDRSLITVSALIASGGSPDRMRSHVALALDNGLKPQELSAIVTQLAFFAGWPNAVGAAEVVAETFQKRGIAIEQPAPAPVRASGATATALKAQIGDVAPALAGYLDTYYFGTVLNDPALGERDRSLVAIAALVATGNVAQLPDEIARGAETGVTRDELSEMLTHLAFYVGWPKAVNAAAVARKVVADRKSSGTAMPNPSTASPSGLRIIRFGAQPPEPGPPQRFTGKVMVSSAFRADPPAHFRGAIARFAPGARSAWHAHEKGQMLIILSGRGLIQVEGGPIETVGVGDVIWTPAGVRHWHGATANSPMSHVAVAEGEGVDWGAAVTDAEYAAGQAAAPKTTP